MPASGEVDAPTERLDDLPEPLLLDEVEAPSVVLERLRRDERS
jgi:hypothetical protein